VLSDAMGEGGTGGKPPAPFRAYSFARIRTLIP